METQATPKKSPFILASLILGILSLITICTGILPLPLGALGILFAILSYRKGRHFDTMALAGLLTSIVGMSVSIVIIIMSFMMLPSMLKSEDYRNQLNSVSEAMYGITFDDMLEGYYGIDIDEIIGNE